MLCHVLAEQEDRVWLAFRQPVADANGARVTTHYVVCSAEQAVLVDPGGTADFGPLLAAISEMIALKNLRDRRHVARRTHRWFDWNVGRSSWL